MVANPQSFPIMRGLIPQQADSVDQRVKKIALLVVSICLGALRSLFMLDVCITAFRGFNDPNIVPGQMQSFPIMQRLFPMQGNTFDQSVAKLATLALSIYLGALSSLFMLDLCITAFRAI